MYRDNKGKLHHTLEERRKISNANKGQIPWTKGKHHSEETKRKIAQSNKGKIVSIETRKKISEARKGINVGYIPSFKGMRHTETTKKKISQAHKGKHLSIETRKKLSKSHKGLIPWCKGKHLSEETKKKIGLANKGKKHKPLSIKARQKISKAHKGKIFSEEHKRKISLNHADLSGKNHPMWGKKWPEEVREKISQAHKGKILSEEHKKKISKAGKGRLAWNKGKHHTIESRKKMSLTHKKNWKNPEWVKKWHLRVNRKPTKPERYLNELLNEWFPNEYKYVGDFSFIIEGKNPDFLNINRQKKLIELFGDYWHRNDDPKERIGFFRQYGFDTLVIWQYELKDTTRLKPKLTSFHNK